MLTKRRAIVFIAASAGLLWAGLRLANLWSRAPSSLGVANGQLAECPDRPNCVSTKAEDPDHRIEPIALDQPVDDAIGQLQAAVLSMPRSSIVCCENGYLHAEFRSLVLGFVDDVEFSIDESGKVIHFRSASRMGHSDLGANRRRMEELRRRFLDRQVSVLRK